MEEDRAQANLGPVTDGEPDAGVTAKPKQPKKRFVGRRTAEKTDETPNSNAIIEDSGAVQGLA